MRPNEPRELGVAVIGVGARAVIARHVPEVHPGARVSVAVDPSPAGRERARQLFGDIPVFPGVPELLETTPDAAIITSPDYAHADAAVALLRAGVPVYVEKPLATTLADADRVLAVSAESGTPLYVGHNFRHAAVVRGMKQLIDDGAIGDVKAIWVRHFVGNGGDYYFKDWHAERAKSNSLLLQKASHDIDVIHYLAGAYTRRVSAMGALTLYGAVADRGLPASGELMPDWFSLDNWPPASSSRLNPVIDVEDLSMMLLALENGVLASYEQCHYTPDYWRNYTVIGSHGRLENFGDTAGGIIRVWNKRREWSLTGDIEVPIGGDASGHEDADVATMREFFSHVVSGVPTVTSPLAARAAVAAGALAADSLRSGARPLEVPPLTDAIVRHFS